MSGSGNSAYVLLLRGINVGGRNRLPMNDLKELLREQGFERVNHYIQSGNLVFTTDESSTEKMEQEIESAITERFGLSVPAMVMSSAKFEDAVSGFPFLPEEEEKSVLAFLSGEGSGEWADRAEPLTGESERYRRIDDVAYLYCPNGLSKSKAAEALLTAPRKGMKVTTRNWRTVNRIIGLLSEIDSN